MRFREVPPDGWGLAAEPHFARGRAVVFWAYPPRHIGMFGSRPQTPADIDEAYRFASKLTRLAEPVLCFVDARTFATEGPIEPVVRAMLVRATTDYPKLAPRLRRQAFLAADDWLGVMWSGTANVLGAFITARASTEPAALWAWLEAPPGLPDAVAALTAEVLGAGGTVPDVAALLSRSPELDLAGAARALGRSARSLQRDLTAAGESFQSLRARVRQRLAETWLDTPELKLEAVAAAVGFRSVTHFTAWFRERTGLSPTEWRARPRP